MLHLHLPILSNPPLITLKVEVQMVGFLLIIEVDTIIGFTLVQGFKLFLNAKFVTNKVTQLLIAIIEFLILLLPLTQLNIKFKERPHSTQLLSPIQLLLSVHSITIFSYCYECTYTRTFCFHT